MNEIGPRSPPHTSIHIVWHVKLPFLTHSRSLPHSPTLGPCTVCPTRATNNYFDSRPSGSVGTTSHQMPRPCSCSILNWERWLDIALDEHPGPEVEPLCQKTGHVFAYRSRSWQAHTLRVLLRGHDLLVHAGTGSSKSLIFQAMALSRPKAIVLIITLTIGLMADQVQ